MAFVGSVVQALSDIPPIPFEKVRGEWIGQCALGDVFRLNIESKTAGSLGYLAPEWENEKVRVHDLAGVNFDGVIIQITVVDREFGDFSLEGLARENVLDLRIKGLYVKSEPRIRFVRPSNWGSALERLREEMEP